MYNKDMRNNNTQQKETKMNTVKIVKVNTCWGAYWYTVKVNGIAVANCGTLSHAQEISKKYS
jgi:hypothetical protein